MEELILSDYTKGEVKSFFGGLFSKFGETETSLGWTKNKQSIRFEQLLRFSVEKGNSLLDVGCGFGDLLFYIQSKKMDIDYYGIDIMQEFINIAKRKHPDFQSRFFCIDFMEDRFERNYDWIVGSGIFGHRLFIDEEKMYQYVESVMRKSYENCNYGFSFDFISDIVDFHSEECFYANPMRILSIAYKFSRNIILNNSIMPFEYNLTLWKDDSFQIDKTVFNNYYKKG